MTDERDDAPSLQSQLETALTSAVVELRESRGAHDARLAKLEAAVRVYDTLGVELVASLKARVDALEAGRAADVVGPT